MKTADIEQLKREIVARLAPLNPEKIILFGSYAWGDPTPDSDIDLYVVTKDDFVPANWQEKNRLFIETSSVLDDLQEQTPIDLIVHTRPMHKRFVEIDSMFSRKILRDGVLLS
ncbi:MAG: nucleotidyltransferase domain-containing protein [Trichloromonas sp.]|jgi:predicted nucleotidyltransferase|nr:nucleotidyltransferase domain-containing protein [Trichloromonas sp.]